MDALNIAHRGARSLAPENTLPAARKALELGADMWELDVGVTADDELVVIHDDTLDRTSNVRQAFPGRKPWKLHEFTLEDLRRLDFGSWFVESDPFGRIAAGEVTAEEIESYRNASILTLAEALSFTRDHDWPVNVEIKDLSRTRSDFDVVERVVALVKAMEMCDRVLLSSFNHAYLKRVRGLTAGIRTGALVSSPAKDPAALLTQLDAQAYNPRVSAVRFRGVSRLREQGFDVYVWTINDEKTMRKLIDAGVSGIFTDFPQVLKRVQG
jgi:glycerophosphoryl diester phosphodiesterase